MSVIVEKYGVQDYRLLGYENSQRTEIWVDNINGNDSNPGTQAKPFKTLIKAESTIPEVIANLIIINILPYTPIPGVGAYVWPTFRARIYRAPLVIRGVGFQQISTGTAQAGSNQFKVVTSGGLVQDEYVITPAILHITSGLATGDYRQISENSVTDIEPSYPFSNAVAAGDTYEVVRPLVQVELQETYTNSKECIFADGSGQRASSEHTGGRHNIVLVNIILEMTNVEDISIRDVGVSFFGVITKNQLYVKVFSENGIMCGVDQEKGSNFPWVRVPSMIEWASDLAVSETSWSGVGLSTEQYLGIATIGNGFAGFIVTYEQVIIRTNQNTSNQARFEPSCYLVGGRAGGIQIGTPATYRGAYLEILAAGSAGQPHKDFKIKPGAAAAFLLAAVECYNACVHLGHVEFGNNWTIDGMLCQGVFSQLQVYQSAGNFGGIGLRAKQGGKIENRGNCTFSGIVGDVSEDDGVTLRAWATYVPGTYWNDLTLNTQAMVYYP